MPRPLRLVLLAIAIILGSAASTRAQTTWYVNASAPPGGDGLTWSSSFQHLQTALANAVSGDQIWVARGTYMPDGGYTKIWHRIYCIIRESKNDWFDPARTTLGL